MVATPSAMMPLGTSAPEFSLPTPGGSPHGTAEAAGAPGLLVVFLCNHCPYVKHVADGLGRLATGWMADGLAVIGVNPNDVAAYPHDAPDLMPAFAAEHGWTFPYLFDESQDVAAAYGAVCTPDFFLFDAAAALVYRGQMDDSRPSNGVPVTGADLDDAVRAVLAGERPSADQRPSVGCSIKWKPGRPRSA
ncbi:MAG: thioredoxin family protein [Acidimicrobiales bacterium]